MSDSVGMKSQRLMALMVGAGAGVGVVFPLVAAPFVTFDSTARTVVFIALCLVAGIGLGLACHAITIRTAKRCLMDLVETAGRQLPVSPREADGLEEAQEELARVFGRVAHTYKQVQDAYAVLTSMTAEILSATEEQASGAAEQAAAVAETSATLEELAQTSKQIADTAGKVAEQAERTLATAEEGISTVAEANEGIEEIRTTTMQSSDRILALGERSQEIGRVLSIIDEIAEQTKILALNAAIEAARAGEAGRGFSVVAEEIRQLADSVTESTQEIGRVVREIQTSASALVMSTEKASNKVGDGKEAVGRTGEALDRIVVHVEKTTDATKQISVATRQQRSASDQVVVSMKEIAQVSQQSADVSRQISAAITDLTKMTDQLTVE